MLCAARLGAALSFHCSAVARSRAQRALTCRKHDDVAVVVHQACAQATSMTCRRQSDAQPAPTANPKRHQVTHELPPLGRLIQLAVLGQAVVRHERLGALVEHEPGRGDDAGGAAGASAELERGRGTGQATRRRERTARRAAYLHMHKRTCASPSARKPAVMCCCDWPHENDAPIRQSRAVGRAAELCAALQGSFRGRDGLTYSPHGAAAHSNATGVAAHIPRTASTVVNTDKAQATSASPVCATMEKVDSADHRSER